MGRGDLTVLELASQGPTLPTTAATCGGAATLRAFGPTKSKSINPNLLLSIIPKCAPASLAASVDHTEARNGILGCFGRSDRRAQRHGLQANLATRRLSAKADQFGAREPELARLTVT